ILVNPRPRLPGSKSKVFPLPSTSTISMSDVIRRPARASPGSCRGRAAFRPGMVHTCAALLFPTTHGGAPISTVRRESTAHTTSFPTARTGRRGEVVRRPMLSVGRADVAEAEEGFTLIEVVCVIAVIAGLAPIILPALPRGTSQSRLEAYAIQMGTL